MWGKHKNDVHTMCCLDFGIFFPLSFLHMYLFFFPIPIGCNNLYLYSSSLGYNNNVVTFQFFGNCCWCFYFCGLFVGLAWFNLCFCDEEVWHGVVNQEVTRVIYNDGNNIWALWIKFLKNIEFFFAHPLYYFLNMLVSSMHVVTSSSCLFCKSDALGAQLRFKIFLLLFDCPFVLNLCMCECCHFVNHDNGVVAQWNVFGGSMEKKMIDIFSLRRMEMIIINWMGTCYMWELINKCCTCEVGNVCMSC